jgi:hypothetical protein
MDVVTERAFNARSGVRRRRGANASCAKRIHPQ